MSEPNSKQKRKYLESLRLMLLIREARAKRDKSKFQAEHIQERDALAWLLNEYERLSQNVLEEENKRLKIALADAIRSPMGVCPDSAQGLLSSDDLELAESRRVDAKIEKRNFSGKS